MRGDGRIFRRKRSDFWWCEYYLHGKGFRESTRETDEKRTEKFLKRRLDEVGADKIGAKKFIGPKAERIKISCGISSPSERPPECECLCCALERDYRLRNKLSPQNASNFKRIRKDFARQPAFRLKPAKVDRYIEELLADGYASASINRLTQVLRQCFSLAVQQERLTSVPFIRQLSEVGNVRQGFYTAEEFEAIRSYLPEYLRDYACWSYTTGMRRKQINRLLWEHQDHDSDDIVRSMPEDVKNRELYSIELDQGLKELIQRRRAARQVTRPDGTVQLARYIFHRDGEPIGDFRRAWQTACVRAGLGRFLCRDCEGIELTPERACPRCGQRWSSNQPQPKYVGRLFHDFRRTAVRDMIRGGASGKVAMSISGHKTPSMLYRYNITDGRDQREALDAMKAYRERQHQKLRTMPVPK